MSSNDNSLVIEELAFAYPDGNQALYGVNLKIKRGERVHLAMIARGYQGDLPKEEKIANYPKHWVIALSIPTLAAVILLSSRLLG